MNFKLGNQDCIYKNAKLKKGRNYNNGVCKTIWQIKVM